MKLMKINDLLFLTTTRMTRYIELTRSWHLWVPLTFHGKVSDVWGRRGGRGRGGGTGGDPALGGRVVVGEGARGDTGEGGKALGQDAREGGNLKGGTKYTTKVSQVCMVKNKVWNSTSLGGGREEEVDGGDGELGSRRVHTGSSGLVGGRDGNCRRPAA